MFEFHGWATIRETAGCDDLRSDLGPQLRWANGDLQLSLGGLHNHRRDEVTTFYAEVAKAAPGSYGVLYIHDDEDLSMQNAWRRLVMRRGEVHQEPDTSLSPHIGLVEDDCIHEDSPNGTT